MTTEIVNFGALIRGHSKRGLSKSSKVLEQLLVFVFGVLLLSPLLLCPLNVSPD